MRDDVGMPTAGVSRTGQWLLGIIGFWQAKHSKTIPENPEHVAAMR